jgi:hypothetical protein
VELFDGLERGRRSQVVRRLEPGHAEHEDCSIPFGSFELERRGLEERLDEERRFAEIEDVTVVDQEPDAPLGFPADVVRGVVASPIYLLVLSRVIHGHELT